MKFLNAYRKELLRKLLNQFPATTFRGTPIEFPIDIPEETANRAFP